MIYTVTFNPAIDYVMHSNTIRNGATNRSAREELYFGGKGINVSLVLKELGVSTKVLGFTAGFTGAAIEQYLTECGIDTDFVHLNSGFSRINVKIKADVETEINGRGPDIGEDKMEEIFVKIDNIQDGDTLVLAGSIPDSLPDDIYEKILARLSHKNIKTVVDATGDLLKNVLKYKPFLIKPNNFELGDMFGVTLNSQEEIIKYAAMLQDMGACNVIVSMAGDGAILLDANGETHFCPAVKGLVVNSVGAGDSMVAGFLAGVDRGYRYALHLGTAAGGATAFSDGLATYEKIMELIKCL